jgi:thiol-disulfide isomerase/thioredoxin
MVRQVKKKYQNKTRRQLSRSVQDGDIDIREEADLTKFDALLSKHPVVLVFIYADWCGHCTTYKPIWEKLRSAVNRQIPMARMNDSVLAKSFMADAKINGYPSVVITGRDKSFASFPDVESGAETNSIPNMRDENIMTKLLTANPIELIKNKGSESDVKKIEDYTAIPTVKAEYALRKAAKKAIRDIKKKSTDETIPSPPDITKDFISKNTVKPSYTRRKRKQPVFGGSLYSALTSIP